MEIPPPANDKCPGEAVSLMVGDAKSISASTAGATNDYMSACGGGDGTEVVYAITLGGDGTFKAKVTAGAGSTLSPVIYLRQACEDDATNIQCHDLGTGGVEFISGEFTAGTYYLVIDGATAATGAFDLALSLSAPMCGDHVLNAGEACDPPSDGCDATCQFLQAAPAQDKCPAGGDVFQVPANGLTVPNQYTTGFGDDYAPTACATGSKGPDRVYQLIPELDGMMTVKVGFELDGVTSTCDLDPENVGCFDRVVYVRTTCGAMDSEIGCSDKGAYSPESVTVPVTAFTQYYVFVDGGSAAAYGSYTLFANIQ